MVDRPNTVCEVAASNALSGFLSIQFLEGCDVVEWLSMCSMSIDVLYRICPYIVFFF